jgi:hypothetical protein
MRTVPEVGGVRPAMRWRIVLFPEPLGPMNTQKEPGGQRNERSATARTRVLPVPNSLVTERNSIMACDRIAP